jgi:hypothetical protein
MMTMMKIPGGFEYWRSSVLVPYSALCAAHFGLFAFPLRNSCGGNLGGSGVELKKIYFFLIVLYFLESCLVPEERTECYQKFA